MTELTAADGHRFTAYCAGAPEQARGLVLCHEYSGLNRAFRRLADQIATLGFHVIAPALFDRAERGLELRYTPADMQRGRAVGAQIRRADTILDITAAVQALGIPSVAILGYDYGANAAWDAACAVRGLRAAICFYGDGIADARQDTPLCPVQLHFAQYDEIVPATHADAIRRAQPQVSIEFYQGATHGFLCDERESYSCDLAELARDNTLAFLRRHMNNAAAPAPAITAQPAPVVPLRPAIDAPRPQAEPARAQGFGRAQAFGWRVSA